jgi:diadenosine tetraphosphatase ApaH/serine/threonine PP2A family protein phosphatase/Ca2+-binding EF-hand superfamily protein
MATSVSPKKEKAAATESGLEPGYAEDKWGPWKSHKLLLSEAIKSDPSWASRAGILSRTFTAFSRARSGFISEKEFNEVLNSFVCCEEVFYHHFFQLFDRDQDGFLTEVDFLSGMLAVSPISEHDLSTPGGQLRLQLIFLYYDANRNGRLDVEELSLMIEHLEQLRSERPDRGPKLETRQMAVSDAKGLMSLYKGGFWYRCLFDACSKGMITGLDQLLRTTGDLATSILKVNPQLAGVGAPTLQHAMVSPPPPMPVMPVTVVAERPQQSLPEVVSNFTPSYPPPQPPVSVAQYQAASAVQGGSLGASMLSATNQSVGSHFALSTSITHSTGSSGPVPLPLRIVRGLMDFTSSGAGVDWRGLKLATASEILQLCDSISVILKDEDSLVSLPFPARLYGDIHGNLPDLIQFFNRYSWPDKRKGDILSMNYVFMGDFVDRGCFSVEVVTLLFALKLLHPLKVYLIRGNHEDRNMNVHYGFRKSCHMLYGPTEGQLVWERVNECFDLLPLAALVGEEVLCIHGGLGESIESVGDLMGIQKPIIVPPDNVDAQDLGKVDKVVLDALWSDPFDDPAKTNQPSTHLSPRGNGANRFTADRVKAFCAKNNLQLIVRAHECVQNGYEYFADGMLLTVFSASSYCNQFQNDGGMVVVLRNADGSMEEHAQVIKSNADTLIGWEDSQYRQPSPMRGVYSSAGGQNSLGGSHQQKLRMPFLPVTYPASPGSSRLF